MRKFLVPPTLFCLFFLIGPSCRFGNEPLPPPAAKVTEVSQDREQHGLQLMFEGGTTKPPSMVSVCFRVRTAQDDPAAGLQCGNIALDEDNEPVSMYESTYRIKTNQETARLSVLLLFDLSGSIVKTSLDSLQRAAVAFVDTLFYRNDSLFSNVELGLYIFDGRETIVVLSDFTTDTGKLLEAIKKISPALSLDNSTNLNGAVVEGIRTIDTRVKSNQALGLVPAGALVIFTDGKDRAGRVETSQALKTVLESDFNVFAIGLRGEIDESVLTQFGKNGFYDVDLIKNLGARFSDVATRVRGEAQSQYRLEYCSPRRKGNHQLKIKVMNQGDDSIFGSITVSFSAEGFTGGCTLDSTDHCEENQ